MKCDRVWQEQIPVRDDAEQLIYCITYNSAGTQVLVAVGKRVLVYDAKDGSLLHSLKGHKSAVYAVSCSSDGKRFASGGADKNVYIWTDKCEGILKYGHNDTIQCLAYNPKDQSLASGTASDFGIWSPTARAVQKHKLKSKCLCMSWTNDGTYLALGLYNGNVSIRDTSGVEKVLIQRTEPVWCLAWSPRDVNVDEAEVLAVGCWDQTLSFYHLSGQQRGSERSLGFDPMSLAWYGAGGKYLLCGGSDHKVSLFSKTGQFLKVVCETSAWVSALSAHAGMKHFAVGRMEALVSVHHTVFSTVHGLYQDRYAYRDTMTEVIIQHLMTEQKVRIKVRDYVKKIAVYKNRLAIQLPGRILIYQCESDAHDDMHYLLRTKIEHKVECNLLVVTAAHILLCHDRKLQLFDFHGERVREWSMDSVIRYIRVVGGPVGREGLLVGLKDGCSYKLFIDNQFPIHLITHTKPVRCLDVNATRERLAVVDEDSALCVYDIRSKKLVFEDAGANSVAWNLEMEDSLCYSGRGQLSIKTRDFPIDRQPLHGFVVGFKGSKIFCLHQLNMRTVDVPQSNSMHQYMANNDFVHAYKVACLGVTPRDWEQLAHAALKSMSFVTARKAFIRLRDNRYVDLLNRVEAARLDPAYDNNRALAAIYSYQGRFHESALLYVKAGMAKEATEMLLDLGEWEHAKQIVADVQRKEARQQAKATAAGAGAGGGVGVSMNDLFRRQGTWLVDHGETGNAAEMFWSAKDYTKAIRLLGDEGDMDGLIGKVRLLTKAHRDELELIAGYFVQHRHHAYAKEAFLKLEDYQALVKVHVDMQKWTEAFELARARPELAQCIYEPYAEALALQDKFEEAEDAFIKAGKPERAMNLLRSLTRNAVSEHRYDEAAFYFWKLAVETLRGVRAVAAGGGGGGALVMWPITPVIAGGGGGGGGGDDDERTLNDLHSSAMKVLDGTHTSTVTAGDNGDATTAASSEVEGKLQHFRSLYIMGNLYYAYHEVYRFTDQPFTVLPSGEIFQRAHMVLNYMLEAPVTRTAMPVATAAPVNPSSSSSSRLIDSGSNRSRATMHQSSTTSVANTANISLVRCLYAFAEIGRTRGAYKSVRTAYEMLQRHRVPATWRDQLDVNSLKVRNKPFSDARDLHIECFRCGYAQSTMLHHHGQYDECQQCHHPFVRSFGSFDVLPLVEFVVADDTISDREAQTLIDRLPVKQQRRQQRSEQAGAQHIQMGDTQALHFDDDDMVGGVNGGSGGGGDDDDDGGGGSSQFMDQLMCEDITYPPIALDREGLRQLHPRDVFVCRWNSLVTTDTDTTPPLIRTQYFKCVVRGCTISHCRACQRFFHEEEFEMKVLKTGACPVCRTPQHNI